MPEMASAVLMVHVIAVIVAQDFNRCVALITKGLGTPLRHPAVAGALYLSAIAVLGEDWLADIRTGQIVGK